MCDNTPGLDQLLLAINFHLNGTALEPSRLRFDHFDARVLLLCVHLNLITVNLLCQDARNVENDSARISGGPIDGLLTD